MLERDGLVLMFHPTREIFDLRHPCTLTLIAIYHDNNPALLPVSFFFLSPNIGHIHALLGLLRHRKDFPAHTSP